MMSTREYCLEKLEGGNWVEWKWQTENVLKAKKSYDVLIQPNDNKVDEDKDQQALALIGGALGHEAKRLVISSSHAWEAWKELCVVYEHKTSFEKQDLLCKLHSFKIENLSNIATNLSELKSIAGKLKLLGEIVSDDALMSIIISSLPKSFDSFLVALKMMPENQRNLQHLMSNVISRAKEISSAETSETALIARSNYEKRQTNSQHRNSSRDRQRSFSQEWQKRPSSRDRQRSSSRERNDTCHYCKKPGHFIRECRKLKYKESLRNDENNHIAYMAVNDIGKIHDNWVADSGSTLHITRNLNWLRNYQTLERPLNIYIGDGSVVYAEGFGTIVTDKLVVKPVYYVPNASANLFSISSAVKDGFSVNITKENFSLIRNKRVLLTGKLTYGVYILDIVV